MNKDGMGESAFFAEIFSRFSDTSSKNISPHIFELMSI